eukprot:UN26541
MPHLNDEIHRIQNLIQPTHGGRKWKNVMIQRMLKILQNIHKKIMEETKQCKDIKTMDNFFTCKWFQSWISKEFDKDTQCLIDLLQQTLGFLSVLNIATIKNWMKT